MRRFTRQSSLAGVLLLVAHGATAPYASAQRAPGAPGGASVPTTASDVRVLLLAFESAEWISRARGQLGDLTPSVSHTAALPRGSIDEQLELVRRLGREQRADMVAWMAPDLTLASHEPEAREVAGTYVLVWTPSNQAHDARRLGEPWGRLSAADRSAALEMGAMSVRSAVRALQLERAHAAAQPPDDAATIGSTLAALPAPELEPWGWRAGAGVQWQLDGQTSSGTPSLEIGLGLRRREWSGSLVATLGLGASVDTPQAELVLARHALGLEVARVWAASARASVAALLQAGLEWSRRETRPSSSDVVATESRAQLAPAAFAGLRGAYPLSAAHALTLELGAGWYPLAPAYVIEDPVRGERFVYAPWKIQPSFAVGWSFAE